MNEKSLTFDLFRYHILPINRKVFQTDYIKGYENLDDLLAHKNEEVFEALQGINSFTIGKTVIKQVVLCYEENEYLLYIFAPKRPVIIENEEFKKEEIPNWPSIYIFIWNESGKQYIAVQNRKKAFQDTATVANAIVKTVNRALKRHNLRVNVEAVFKKNEFWKLIEEYKGKVQWINFELITPNLSDIAAHLSDELKEFAKNSNTAKTSLEIRADPASSILLDPEDPTTKGLVEYSSEGAGNVFLKMRGIRQKFVAGDNIRSVTIDELEISGTDSNGIVSILKRLIK